MRTTTQVLPMHTALLSFFVGATLFLLSASLVFADHRYTTQLSGENEIPSVETDTLGEFEITFDDENATATTATYTLSVAEGVGITVAHLHCGTSTENGPPVVFLHGSTTTTTGEDVDGLLAEGTINDEDILPAGADCALPITDVESLRSAAAAGAVYANVHSEEHPAGLIRGQLTEEPHPPDDTNGEIPDDENGDGTEEDGDEEDDDVVGSVRDRLEAKRERIDAQLRESQERINTQLEALRERIAEQFDEILERI